MAVICTACTIGDDVVELPNMLELKKHEMLGHPRPEKVLPVDPRGDHPSATELKEMENKKQEKPPVYKAPPASEASSPVPPLPLKLQYKWEGQCPTCRDSIKTIEVEMPSHNIIVAYCVRCDKKLKQEKVIPLSNQLSQHTPDTFEKNLRYGKK